MRSKRLALDSILLALAAAFSFLESMIPTPVGIRLGLSSIVVMYALLCLSKAEASAIVLLKACFALITRGFYAGILSLSGSFLVIVFVIKKTPFFLFFLTAIFAVIPIVDILAPVDAVAILVYVFILTGIVI